MAQINKEVKVMIVDDHPIVRNGLADLINHEKGLFVCCEAENAEEAMKYCEKSKPDFMIVDISLQGIDGIELTRLIMNQYPKMFILILSMHDETMFAERALKVGARGYIMKHEGTENLIKAIKRIIKGEIYISDEMNSVILKNYLNGHDSDATSPFFKLTERELVVFELIGRGYANRTISEMLHVSVKTIETHRENIKKKLNLQNSFELVHQAINWIESKNLK